MSIKVQAGDYKGRWHRVRIEGDYAEVMSMAKPTAQGVRKLSKDSYLVLSTGEVRQYQKKDNKTQGESLRRTMERLRGLIRCNFGSDNQNECFLTLTYAENMRDTGRLMRDWETFYKRLKRAYKQYNLGYLSVAEPQARGAWHLHILLKDMDGKKLWIDKDKLTALWGHGMTQIERIHCDDVGAYFVTYFTQVQSHKWDIAEPKGARTHGQDKASRLHLYPSGFNFYRASRNLDKPIKAVCNTAQLEDAFEQLIRHKSYDIIDADTGEVINRIERQTRKQ